MIKYNAILIMIFQILIKNYFNQIVKSILKIHKIEFRNYNNYKLILIKNLQVKEIYKTLKILIDN